MNKAPNKVNTVDTEGNPCVKLTFTLQESTSQLKAVLSEADTPFDQDLLSIRSILSNQGLSGIEINDETLLSIMRKARKGETGEILIGSSDDEKHIAVTFEYSPDTRELFAIVDESDKHQDISGAALQKALIQQGFGSFLIAKKSLINATIKAQNKEIGRYLLGKKPEYTVINFSLDGENNTLMANLRPCENEVSNDVENINIELEALGYADFYFEAGAVEKLATKARNNERGQFIIAQKKDAQIHFECDEDFMTAFATVSPPYGGRDLDENLLNVALADAGIYKECCNSKIIEKILSEKTADHVKIAEGIIPKDGEDAAFEALVKEVEYSSPKESKTGKIDLREVISFTLVEAGVPLMKRTPAKQGINGRNVKGQVIPAYEGDDTPFDEKLPGVEISQDDPDLLISSCKGHPVILARGVRVDNTIVVNNVDMSTGNIDYDGSILVKGEVKAGMKISVTGDIIVKGVVTKATLNAKNNITIECGAIGSDPSKDGEESPPTVLKAGGNIQAQYINLADIHAGRDIIVREYISHCTTSAKQKVLVGQAGGKGRIFGGECYGQAGIFANSIGANGGIKTMITVGTPAHQTKQLEQLIKNNNNRQEQSDSLAAMLKKYEEAFIADPTDLEKGHKAEAIKKVMADIQHDIDKMSNTINKIKRIFKDSNKAEVSVAKSTYPNVQITINGADFHIRQESKGGIFVKQGADIRWQNFKRK